ncbi:glycosyltransferase [Prochlorococcus marinus]|uniref:glycosyltransferase n=1 Tax=Prochlorococcus marinus TaxID=1219 RepID=UPI0007B3788F|nr:glycosyltransferase [Prochlorococcus marinus]KZR73744.1 GDP-mannose-dependent alpha-(1-6)-phosphatidylinositol monomannoside mannosyltransferase [Prochlorococcus marinus str. MIT 1320]
MSSSTSRFRLLAFVPSGRAPSETFIRANLRGLPFETLAYFGDEFSWRRPWQLSYAVSVGLSKVLYRLGLRRFGSIPSSVVAWLLCCQHRPNALIAEFGFHAVRMMEASAWSGIPLVVQFHGSDASARSRLVPLGERYRRLFAIASGVVAKSEPMRQKLVELGAAPESVVVSPCGADADLFLGADPGHAPPIFLSVGRFVAKKGPLLTIQAFAAARDRLLSGLSAQMRLVMVGDGPLLPAARRLVVDLGLEAQVEFSGFCSSSEVAELMRACRAFLQHSLVAPDGDSEGSPVSVMEAQLSGLPVVSTHHAGIPEVVLEGKTGLLVNEGDVEGMARAIALLVDDPDLAASLGKAARLRASSSFTVAHHIDAVADLVKRVAG